MQLPHLPHDALHSPSIYILGECSTLMRWALARYMVHQCFTSLPYANIRFNIHLLIFHWKPTVFTNCAWVAPWPIHRNNDVGSNLTACIKCSGCTHHLGYMDDHVALMDLFTNSINTSMKKRFGYVYTNWVKVSVCQCMVMMMYEQSQYVVV